MLSRYPGSRGIVVDLPESTDTDESGAEEGREEGKLLPHMVGR